MLDPVTVTRFIRYFDFQIKEFPVISAKQIYSHLIYIRPIGILMGGDPPMISLYALVTLVNTCDTLWVQLIALFNRRTIKSVILTIEHRLLDATHAILSRSMSRVISRDKSRMWPGLISVITGQPYLICLICYFLPQHVH